MMTSIYLLWNISATTALTIPDFELQLNGPISSVQIHGMETIFISRQSQNLITGLSQSLDLNIPRGKLEKTYRIY